MIGLGVEGKELYTYIECISDVSCSDEEIENNTNVSIGPRRLAKGISDDDVLIHHGPTFINVQVWNPFFWGTEPFIDMKNDFEIHSAPLYDKQLKKKDQFANKY